MMVRGAFRSLMGVLALAATLVDPVSKLAHGHAHAHEAAESPHAVSVHADHASSVMEEPAAAHMDATDAAHEHGAIHSAASQDRSDRHLAIMGPVTPHHASAAAVPAEPASLSHTTYAPISRSGVAPDRPRPPPVG